MSDHSDDDRRSDSQHSHDGYDSGEETGHNNDFTALLVGADADKGETGKSRAQFHVGSIPNELGDEELISFDCQNDVMLFVGVNGKVIIRDTKTDDKPIVATIPSAYKGFASPDGQHVFVSTLDGNLHYFSLHIRKAVAVQKVNKDTGSKQAMVVESVAWHNDFYGKLVTTGNVLLGSKAGGLIFAARVDVASSPPSATFVHCRHVIQLPESDNSPVHGLKIIRNASIHSTTVLATTTSRMYPFVGKDTRVNKKYIPLAEEEVLKMYKVGKQCEILDMGLKSNVTKGTLAVMQPNPSEGPLAFAWLSSSGVTHGLFAKQVSTVDEGMKDPNHDNDARGDDEDNYETDFDSVDESAEVADQFANQCHIPIGQHGVGSGGGLTANHPNNNSNNNAQQKGHHHQGHRMPSSPPIDIAISAFHMFVLYENRMVVLGHPAGLSWRAANGVGSELTEVEVSARIRFDPYENRNMRIFIGMTRDERTRKVFYFNKFAVYELSVENEHVGQWKLFLNQAIDKDADKSLRIRAFEAALKLSFGSAVRRDLVSYAYGKYLIELRCYQRAASMFAQCDRFEDIFMFLRDLRRPAVLLDYLEKRYKCLFQYRDNTKGGSHIPADVLKRASVVVKDLKNERGGKFAAGVAPISSKGGVDAEGNLDASSPRGHIGAMESQLICLLCAIIQLKLEAINRKEALPDHDKDQIAEELEMLKIFTLRAVDNHRAAMTNPAINNTIGRLFTAHGRVDLMLAFSEKLGHVRYAIHFFISRARYEEACKLLIERCSVKGQEEVWYAFAPRLIQHVPMQLINGMNNFKVPRLADDGRPISADATVRALDPARLIPAFVHYRPSMNEPPTPGGRRPEGHKAIPYIRNCIRQDKNMNPLVHNFYVSLLAEFDVGILKQFLQQDDGIDFVSHNYYNAYGGGGGGDVGSSNRLRDGDDDLPVRTTAYDPQYALRQCIKFHRHQYCVPLYKRLGLYEDAIAIALESSRPTREGDGGGGAGDDEGELSWDGLTTVTDEILDKRPEWIDPSTFKELWLGVARRVIEKVGTRDTLAVVERSKGVLKLEDILPDIGDSTVIQDFKESIVNALNEYTESINAIKQKEEEAKRVSANIKREIDTLQSCFGYVSSRQQCLLCHTNVFGGSSDRPFLVFPNCKHVFHEDCVKARMVQINAFSLLKAESDELPAGYLEGVVADEDVATLECIYCGELAIAEITAPMITEEVSSWDAPDFKRR